MKKKKLIIIGVVLFVTIIVAVITINQVSKCSHDLRGFTLLCTLTSSGEVSLELTYVDK